MVADGILVLTYVVSAWCSAYNYQALDIEAERMQTFVAVFEGAGTSHVSSILCDGVSPIRRPIWSESGRDWQGEVASG